MPKTAIATKQRAWECRWIRREAGVDHLAIDQPHKTWVCVRTGIAEPVSEGRCEECPFWETGDDLPPAAPEGF